MKHSNKEKVNFWQILPPSFIRLRRKKKGGFVILAVLFFAASLIIFFTTVKNSLVSFEYSKGAVEQIIAPQNQPKIKHLKTPVQVRGIYISSWVAGTPYWREELVKFIDSSELNSVIIDVKDYSGRISFKTENPDLTSVGSPENRISDIKEFIDELHNKKIYAIARISVFQDGYLAKSEPRLAIKNKYGGIWKDNKGVAWLDPANPEVWDYIIKIGREAEKVGFDELNFDYIRFPSDGKLENASYDFWDEKTPKAEVIKSFFAYLYDNLKSLPIPLSADLFGLTTIRTDDMNIGQILENAIPYFDYISPMVYPSHYPSGFDGYKNPASHPYEVIMASLNKAVERLNAASSSPLKLRPWLQDFDLGADYNAEMIKKEKQAVYDAGLNSWLMWDPRNKYTREAYEK